LFGEAFKVLHLTFDSLNWRQTPGLEQLYCRFAAMLDAQAWTSAAEMLVPEGWEWTLTEAGHCEMIRDRQRGPMVEGNAAHPSLALLSAIMRAERKDHE
jgi:hypothetical protein